MYIEEALSKMKSPRDRRPSIMRQGVLQLWVTRACDKACCGCTQGSNLGGKPGMITPEQFEQACVSLRGPNPYWGVVGMFGGNPCLHPQFDELCRIMRACIPWEQRGLWSNNLMSKGKHARITFNPAHSNFNVHQDRGAYEEFRRDWPEAFRYVKGLDEDSRHVPPFVSMTDLGVPEGEQWEMISRCDVNQFWSAMVGVFRGELRGWFCEIAGAMAMLHQNENWPDIGVPIVINDKVNQGWWDQSMTTGAFASQAKHSCPRCGIPLRSEGLLANGDLERVSKEHEGVYHLKGTKGSKRIDLVMVQDQLRPGASGKSTSYLSGEGRKYK